MAEVYSVPWVPLAQGQAGSFFSVTIYRIMTVLVGMEESSTNSYSKSLATSSFRIMILFIRILCSQRAGARSIHTASGGHCRKHPDPGATRDVLVDSGVDLGGLGEP